MNRKARKLAAVSAAELERVRAIRMQMLEMHPFWGYLLLQVQIVPAPELPCIAATDCVRHIWFNPRHTRHLSVSQLGFVIAHEIGHQLFVSHDRRRGRNRHLWNCATDYAINRIISRIAHPARPGRALYGVPNCTYPDIGSVEILLDDRYDDMIAEAIYEYLAAEALPEPVQVSLTLDLNGPAGPHGQAGGGTLRLPQVTDHGGGIDIHLPEDLTDAQREMVADRMAAAVQWWAHHDRAGHTPGNILRRFQAGRRSRVPWRRIFRGFVGQATAREEYSLRRPNLRYLEHDIVVPGLVSDRVGHVVVSVDTSGSMSNAQLDEVGSELRHISDQVEEMTLIVADAKVRAVIPSDEIDRFVAAGRMKGGGGTDHRPVFDWIRNQGLRPDVFVGLTDLFSNFPERRPPYPVLWVAPEQHGDPPWGRILEMS